jgi:putative ABC transport system permease protein
MEKMLHDAKYSLRVLAKSPGFSAMAVLTLALGIGANTAMFSAINSVLLRPLPFQDPDRLVQLYETEAAPGSYPFAGPDYLDWQAQNQTLEAMSLYTWTGRYNVSGAGEPQTAASVRTQANFFKVLGVQPLLGRTFAAGEDQEGKNRVALLSYGFWQRNFGGDITAVGKSIELNSEKYSVIGVMPAWFNYPPATEIWTPFDMSTKSLGNRGSHSFRALGRLKTGATASQAQADLVVIAKRLEQQYPDSNEKVGAAVFLMKDQITMASREQLLILLGAVALVLLVACANVANLLLARAAGRQREIAMRLALGASRWRLVRLLLTESVLLSFAGAVAGLAAAWWCTNLLQSARALPIPRVNPVQIDGMVLLFTIALSMLVGVLFGIAPALQASRLNMNEELKSSGHAVLSPSGRRRLLRDALVVAEISVSLALLVGAGLLLRSFAKMRNAEIGVQTQNVLTMGINLPEKKYSTLVARRDFFDQLLSRIQSSPGVRAASVSTVIPLEGGSNGYITVPGRNDSVIKNQLFEWNYATPDYFRAFGIPFLQGRNFTAQDVDRAAEVSLKAKEIYSSPNPPKELPADLSRVAVINRSMARLVWPNQDPIGRVFKNGGGGPVTVIGVVADVKVRGIRQDFLPQAYFPLAGALNYPWNWNLVVKTGVTPLNAIGTMRNIVSGLDPGLAVIRPRTMDDVISDSMLDTSLQTLLLSVFATLAVSLAAVGLYSVLAFLVSQRRHEIGIRMALGARENDVLRLVLLHGAKLIVIGVVIGIGSALWLTRLIRSLLFGILANDLATFVAVPIGLALVAFIACYIPARRATRVDPIVALRCD